jgi:hypothetical protein
MTYLEIPCATTLQFLYIRNIAELIMYVSFTKIDILHYYY